MQAELATPTQFKGRLNELLSQVMKNLTQFIFSSLVHFHTSLCFYQVRLQSQTAVLSGGEKYSVDQFALTDIRNVLKDQQEGIQVHLSTDCMYKFYKLKLKP